MLTILMTSRLSDRVTATRQLDDHGGVMQPLMLAGSAVQLEGAVKGAKENGGGGSHRAVRSAQYAPATAT
ncbi:unnamed protein product [Toxocara canis]|uniref:Single-stranded DNA-binding protein n=1 Tax=Toxocara canis TaxID=6265 RepID=A0A183UVQ4_TOXCA|nr:unnamed protein product [Toxocara canis]